jgi:hypothetical protein
MFFRSTWSSSQCVDYMVGYWYSSLYGYSSLPQSKFCRETNQNDRCSIIRCCFQYCVSIKIEFFRCFSIYFFSMFFVLHANVCGTNIPHHGHSHGGGDYEHLEDNNPEHLHDYKDDGGNNHNHSHNDKNATGKDNSLTGQAGSEKKPEKVSSKYELSDNINVRAAIVHVIGDFLQSVGVLVAAILIKINVCSKK